MDDVQLRSATGEDLPAVNALMHASRAYVGDYAAMLEGYSITPAMLEACRVAVAERGGEILGFYSLIVDGEPELDALFVADAAQGLDLGRRLFSDMRAAARARGLARVRIVSHPPALGFYLRMGAVQVGATEPAGRITWSRPILEVTP